MYQKSEMLMALFNYYSIKSLGHGAREDKIGDVFEDYCVKLLCSAEYLEKAKNQGHSLAALELASIYQDPECQNYQRAYECAKIAASHSVAEGEFILGNLLFWGRGCEADMDKAYEMYSAAYQHGIFYASIMMKKITQFKS